MHKQGHGKSVSEYNALHLNILMSNVMAEILLIFTCLYTSRYEDRGRDPTSKGPQTGVKCKQRNAHTCKSIPSNLLQIL